jgi:hypothetical protein
MPHKLKLASLSSKLPFVLYYQGNYNYSPTISIITIVEQHFKSRIKKSQLKKIIFTLIEALQNIERYSAHALTSDDFVLMYSDNQYLNIYTQNIIKNDKMFDLKNKLDYLSGKNKEELKSIYKEVLISNNYTEKGAGLGLIEIARKSEDNLIYTFQTKNETHSVYSLNFSISLKEENSEKPKTISHDNLITKLKENFNSNNRTLFYGGDFSKNLDVAIIDIINVSEINKSKINQTQNVFLELSKNIKKHAVKIDDKALGQLFLEWENEGINIGTYNISNKSNISCAKEKIKFIELLDLDQLKALSSNKIMSDIKTEGFGLVDISTHIFPEKILIRSNDTNEDFAEILLTAKINAN